MTTNLEFAAPDVEAEVGTNIGGSEFGFVAGDLDDAAGTAGLHEIVHALGYEGLQTSRSRTDEDAYFVKVDTDTTANMDGGGEGDTLVHEVGHWL